MPSHGPFCVFDRLIERVERGDQDEGYNATRDCLKVAGCLVAAALLVAIPAILLVGLGYYLSK